MGMGKRNNYFNNLGDVLKGVKNSLKIEEGLKQKELIELWPKIIGSRFKNVSKILYVYERNRQMVLMVAVSSSTVAQELSFFKKDIINKINGLSKEYNYNVADIFFDQKLWDETQEDNKKKVKDGSKKLYKIEKHFTEKDLNEIKLSEDVMQRINSSFEEQEFHSEELKQKMYNTVLKDLKEKEWMKRNGFPVCDECGSPLRYFTNEEKNLCPVCKFKEK